MCALDIPVILALGIPRGDTLLHCEKCLSAHARRRARRANDIHSADEATGQVDAVHPPQSDAIAGAIEGHDVIIALRTMQESALHS